MSTKRRLSDLCDEYDIQPNQVYKWQGLLFENAAVVLERAGRQGKPATVGERRVQHLEEQLQRKEAKLQQKNGPQRGQSVRGGYHGRTHHRQPSATDTKRWPQPAVGVSRRAVHSNSKRRTPCQTKSRPRSLGRRNAGMSPHNSRSMEVLQPYRCRAARSVGSPTSCCPQQPISAPMVWTTR